MSSAKSVGAEFALQRHQLTVSKSGSGSGTVTSSPAGIACGATCAASFDRGTVVTLSASATSGSSFVKWTGACSGSGSCNVSMSAAKSVGAEFALVPKYSLSVSSSGNGSGTVTSSPAGINCGSDCEEAYEQGTKVTLSPAAGGGSEFKGWSGACSGTGTCEVTMSAAKSVEATFDLETHQLAASKSGAGSGTVASVPAGIDCGTTCSASFDYSTSIKLTGAPDAGSELAGWTGCDSINAGECMVTIDEARQVEAHFDLESHQLIVDKSSSDDAATVMSIPAGIDCGESV